MSATHKPGQTLSVKITRSITRAAAHKTIERLFMKDKALAAPLLARSRNFKHIPKRRGGQIWTKIPNKIHVQLKTGTTATLKSTAQVKRDLASVAEFVEVAAK